MISRKTNVNKGATLLAEGTEFVGNIAFESQLIVNGRIEGNIDADPQGQAMLVVGKRGYILGRVSVPNVVVDGYVEGEVHAASKVELAENAHLVGEIHYRSIEVQLGAKLEGRLKRMTNSDERNVRRIRDQQEIS